MENEEMIKKMGYKRDLGDIRDNTYKINMRLAKNLPSKVDLKPRMPPVYDQDNLSSCTAHSTAAQCHYIDKTDPFMPSRLFIYYNTRVLEGTVKQDSGASIRNSIKSIVRWGFCPETDWEYNIAKFANKPPTKAYKDAANEKVIQYYRVDQNERALKAALASNLPINFGFSIYSSFDNVGPDGIVTIPDKSEQLLGGHATLIISYNDETRYYGVRNSWGVEFGQQGYFYLPYDYVHNPRLAADFWVVCSVP